METENAYKRKKQPELVRRALLDKAARITLEQGLSKVTFQAVADAVGVTKGGVMHHFTTKNALVMEVFHDAMKKFETEVDAAMARDLVSYGAFTRAYINATISLGEKGQQEFNSQATLYVLMLGDRQLRELWAEWSNAQLKKHAVTDNTETLCMVRLVADGIWLSDFSGINISDKKSIRERLIKTTYPENN